MWKRRKDLLYIGSVHGGELPEFYGVTGDHIGTDAIGKHLSAVSILIANWDSATSQLHQPPRPQLPEGIKSPEPVIKRHLAQIYPRQQEDAPV